VALRSSAQGHRLDFAGPYPASSRPLSVCGFVRVIENANTWATLVGLGQDADTNLTQLGVNTGNTSNLQLVCYQLTPTWNEILETVNTGLSTGQDFFWGISFPSGTAKPTFFWRALSTPTLSTSTPGGTAGTWTFTPSRLSLNYLSGLLAGEWANARQSGVRLWNRTLTAGEMLSESFSLHARNRQGLVLDAPCILDGRDLSQFGAGRVGTITGMTVEPGPPVGWGSSTVAGPTGIVEEWEGPRVASSATTVGTTSAGGKSITLPSGVAAGDLLMAFAANDTSVSWSASAGWEKIDDGANGSAVQGACWAKIAAGSDTLTITGEANDIAVVTIRIPAAQHGVTDVTTIAKGTAATGSSNAPNGPNCNPGTSGKWLWLTYYAADDDDNTALWWPVEGAPVAQVKSATGTSSCQVGVAYRWLEASSYDPSAFALSASEEWRAQTFAIPAAASNATYDEDTTDSGALTDASAAMMLLVGSASDSGVLTDTASGQRVSGDAISDSGALTDTAAGGLALAASASDSGALTDAATGAVSAAEVVSDSGAGSDTATSTWVVGESVTDAADVTDQVTDVGIWLEAASDSAAATDAAMDTLASVDSLADSVATTDTATAALTLAEVVSDPAAATDAATVELVVAEVLSDSVEATDSAADQVIYAEAVSDSADLSDTTTGDSGLDISVIDSAEASESVSTLLIASDALTDAAESSDGVVVTAVYQEVVSDSLSATESVVESVGGHSYFESVEDALEASDSTLATLLSFGASVRSQGGGSGGGRLWTRDLDDEIEAEMGAILKGPLLTSEVIEEITARLDSPPQTRIMEHRRPAKVTYSPPVLDFQAVQAKKRRNRQRLLLLL